MDLAFRYSLIVQIIKRNGHDVFYGYAPDFKVETFEAVDPGNKAQEFMFHIKMRRLIGQSITAFQNEGKELPAIRSGEDLSYSTSPTSDEARNLPSQTVSTTTAAQMLGVHPDTIRVLFDAGTLKGTLSKGGQRMISVSSLQEEEARMKHRADLRKLELRAKKKNSRRKIRRVQKQREEKLERLQESLDNLPLQTNYHPVTKF